MKPLADQAVEPADIGAQLDARYRGPLIAYFLKRVDSRAEAEDLTQEVFVRLIARAEALAPDMADGFVFTVAANLLRDRGRRTGVRQAASRRLADADDPMSLPQVEDRGPERVLLGRESLNHALAALDELGDRTRDIFLLFRLENMRQYDIAALYGLSVSAVEKHVNRAAAHLAKRMIEMRDTP